MNLMDRLAATLDDADELLADVDAQTIDECLARGEAPDHRVDDGEACPWCHHGFHGLGCYPPPQYVGSFLVDVDDAALQVTEIHDSWFCRCDSSLTRPDDTWRPPLRRLDRKLYEHMDRTGLDGWASRADIAAGGWTFDPASLVESFRAAGGAIRAGMRQLEDAVLIGPRGVMAFSSGGVMMIGHAGEDPMDLNDPPLADRERALVAPEAPLTPQARALQHRQTRNTGPARPPAGRAPRPRRHT